jgi:hypothetical protein
MNVTPGQQPSPSAPDHDQLVRDATQAAVQVPTAVPYPRPMQTNGNRPQWTSHETARLIHTICDPSLGQALARYAEGLTRAELDARLPNPFQGEFLLLYNNPEYRPAHPDATNTIIRGMDPNQYASRDAETLKSKFSELRKDFTSVYDKWSLSGQNNPDNFWNFCQGKKTLLYAFVVWKQFNSIEIVLKIINEGDVDSESHIIQLYT